MLILAVCWAAAASSGDGCDDGGGGGGGDDNGGGSGTPGATCTTVADCGGNTTDLCAGRYQCVAGLCVWQDPPSCAGLPGSNACNQGSCDPATGRCLLQALPDGSWCDDANPCSTGETCSGGRCAGGRTCDDGNPCTIDRCDPTFGCQTEPAPQGTACTPESTCLVAAACDGYGSCTGAPRGCDDGNPCTWDTCQEGLGCTSQPVGDGSACEDGNPCTGPDRCRAGRCDSAQLEDGSACDDGNPCTGGSVCQEGRCGAGQPVGDGGACDDADPCTAGTVCQAGACGDGATVTCPPDGLDCTDDACQRGAGCTYPAAPAGTPCTLTEPAIYTVCVAAAACQGRECVPTATAPNGTACEDGDPCTAGSTCQGGTCTGGTRLGDGAACDDGNPCTEAERCQEGRCVATRERVCTASGPCVQAWCDPDQGCVESPVNEGSGCDDGDPCTNGDACRSGVCTGFAWCDDGDPCTSEECPGSECVHEWVESPECPQEVNCMDLTDDDGDGTVDCAAPYCARFYDPCQTVRPIPSRITFEEWPLFGFGTEYDPARPTDPRWGIDATPASPAALSGQKTLNFNDGAQAGWSPANARSTFPASLCCWDNEYRGLPVYVTWMEYVDLPTQEQTAGSDVSVARGFRFVRQDGSEGTVGTVGTLDVRAADRGHWRRRVVVNPAHAEIGEFGVEWFLSTGIEGWSEGAGWFIDDVEVLLAEDCANGVDDNGNGATDCADALCDDVEACREQLCDNDVDDNGDGATDCDDQDCARLPVCE
jgi:hypothetical protein